MFPSLDCHFLRPRTASDPVHEKVNRQVPLGPWGLAISAAYCVWREAIARSVLAIQAVNWGRRRAEHNAQRAEVLAPLSEPCPMMHPGSVSEPAPLSWPCWCKAPG
jgi:hypothetical protein